MHVVYNTATPNDFASDDSPVQQRDSGSPRTFGTLGRLVLDGIFTLDCENANQFDSHAVALMKSGEILDHMQLAQFLPGMMTSSCSVDSRVPVVALSRDAPIIPE